MEREETFFRANTDIGQNFLVDRSVLDRIVEAAEISSEDILFEIGSGKGILTKRLLSLDPKLLFSVEMDKRLARFLARLEENSKLVLIWGDVLKISLVERLDPIPTKLVANLPYHITTPVLWKILEELVPAGLRKMVIMVQKEAAERIASAKPGKTRSPLGITLERMGEVSWLFDVPPEAFRPSPKVNSSVLSITLRRDLELAGNSFWRGLLRGGFSQRRKTLLNNLKGWLASRGLDAASVISEIGLKPQVRAEELTLEDWISLEETVKKKMGGL